MKDGQSAADGMIGRSAAMKRLRHRIDRIGRSAVPVLIHGPTGSGKELAARALHARSGRSGRFVPFNVCAISDGMFEDTLFGHVRGAFTGAARARAGYLREADGGTLFLDEIGDLPLRSQAKLLRALETGDFRAVGSDGIVRSDFRLVTATHQDLDELVEKGAFRADLLYRIRGVRIAVPSLRDRPGDIPLLVAHFAASEPSRPTFSPEAVALIRAYTWPGNVRELRHTVSAAIALTEGPMVQKETIAELLGPEISLAPREEAKRRELEEALEQCEWDIAGAAERLGVHQGTVYRRCARFGVPLPSDLEQEPERRAGNGDDSRSEPANGRESGANGKPQPRGNPVS